VIANPDKMETNHVISLDELNKSFDAAAHHASKLSVPNESRLKLYALYKQATQGDCLSAEPSRLRAIERAKWVAYKHLEGMTEASVKQSYIDLVKRLDPAFDRKADLSLPHRQVEAPENTISIVVESSTSSEPTRLVIQEDRQKDERPPVTVARVEVPPSDALFDIEIERIPTGALRTSQLRPLGMLQTNQESPLPTWAVFILGVLFLCLLDENITLGNVLLNGLGVSLLTTAIISLQSK